MLLSDEYGQRFVRKRPTGVRVLAVSLVCLAFVLGVGLGGVAADQSTSEDNVFGDEPAYLNASFTYDPPAPEIREVITFNASESSSPNGEIAEYRWDFTDNGSFEKTSVDPLANWTYPEIGNNTVTLEVEDTAGVVNETNQSVRVDFAVDWSFETVDGDVGIITSSPTIVDDTVYVGSNDGNLYAFDQRTGDDVWRHAVGITGGVGTPPVASSPQVVDDTAYLLVRHSYTTYLTALDWDTGETLWKEDVGSTSGLWDSSPTVDNGTVYVGSRAENSLFAFDAETGEEEWVFETGGNVESSPTVVDDTVFVGSNDYNVYAVHANNGSQKWSVSTGERVFSSPTYHDGMVYVGSFDNDLYAIDAEGGTVAWSEPVGAQVRASPTVYNDTVYIGSYDWVGGPGSQTNVSAFTTTGDLKWSVEVAGSVTSSPTVANEMVFLGIGDNDGNVTALDAETGETQAKFQSGESVLSSPTMVDGILYIKSSDDFVYALDTGTTASSVDSRVRLGTFGHHENRTGARPTVGLSVDPLQPVVNEEATFDASESDTPRGEISEYRWDFTDDGTFEEEGSDPVTQWTFDEAGTHTVTVEIETTRGDVATRTISVTAVDESGLTETWRYDANSSVRSSSTVVDGTVVFGSNDGNVTAVDEDTGEKEWTFETGSVVRSSPTVVDGVVYVGSNDNYVYALDLETGDELWAFEADSVVYSSPTVSDDTVYVASHDGTQSRFPSLQSFNGTLFAINASSGEERWSFDTGDYLRSSPTVYNDTVYVTSQDNYLYALDAATGNLTWKEEGLEDIYSSPIVADGLVIVTADWGFSVADENVFAFDATSGEKVWEAEISSVGPDEITGGKFLKSSPTVVGETVYVGGAGRLYALDLQTGERVWDTEIEGLVRSSPTVAGGTVYVGSDGNSSDEGFLAAIDAETGDSEWTLEVNGAVYASPTVVDGTIYVGSLDGMVRAIDTAGNASSVDSRVLRGTLGHHDRLGAVLRYAPDKPFATGAITFDGLDSGAPAGSIVEYRWDFTDDGSFEETTSEPITTWTYDDGGEQTVTLEVEDDDANVGTTTRTLDVADVPVATFSVSPEEPVRGEAAVFDANESSLPSDIVWYRWDFTGDGEFDESTFDPDTAYTYDDAGNYTVMLEVEDESGLTRTTNQTVTVVDPVEMLLGTVTDNRDDPLEGATVEIFEQEDVGDPDPVDGGFNTTTTTDADGTFETQVEEGVYKLTVDHQVHFPQVREDIEVEAEETKTVDTIALNPYPDLLEGYVTDAETGEPIVGATVETRIAGDLYAETTTNASGWYVVGHDGGWLRIEYTAEGYEEYETQGGSGTKNVSLDPLADAPPTAAFEFTPDEPVVGQEVTFDAGMSSVPGGAIEEYRWDFNGNGSFDETTSDPVINHTYDTGGDYDVTLEVEDDDGQTDETTQTVVVEAVSDAVFEVSIDDINTSVAHGDDIVAAVTVENVGSETGSQTIVFEVDGTEHDSVEMTLDDGQSQTETFTHGTVDEDVGDREVTVASDDDSDSATVTIEHSVVTYADGDSVVETGGLLDAIGDWRDDDIETSLLLEVINAWRSGESVV